MADAEPLRRVQLRRLSGWTMPPNTMKVDRTSPFGNPWSIARAREAGFTGTDAEVAALCVGMFRNAMERGLPACEAILTRLPELRGKNLACWCRPGDPCHADVLLEFANGPP